ncbi:polyhydroxyalkanoate synthesis repressor PhaR [Limimonas halophila]|uniref:Polyhydroxyalkanoate synthesis repressor PhaR n=1 Tax=Limimonas halophila TaxID=1082479 RepID=A0A1G7UVN3_9PROT|nr:polyhydroxyalkanoate synthesis repressor PhaR [Limimonas halophila]SDG51566.1 polyhydroxyalkanoate synthesis repressor PhaR [Limimonas halophila]
MARETSGGKARGNKANDIVVIKKYANRRLYNTATSSYVTLEHLRQMVRDEVDFAVYDAKTGEDITRSVLTQIIVEEEAKGTNLLPISFLRQLISFYGDSMQTVVPAYLEQMMSAFAANQERMREQMQETMSGMFPFSGNLQELGRQNAALMESAMRMFSPFGTGANQQGEGESAAESEGQRRQPDTAREGQDEQSLAELQKQVNTLQEKIEQLTREQGGDEGASTKDPNTQ